MILEFIPVLEHEDDIVISVMEGCPEVGVSVAIRRHEGKPGHFSHQWILEELDPVDALEIATALARAAHAALPPVCPVCRDEANDGQPIVGE